MLSEDDLRTFEGSDYPADDGPEERSSPYVLIALGAIVSAVFLAAGLEAFRLLERALS